MTTGRINQITIPSLFRKKQLSSGPTPLLVSLRPSPPRGGPAIALSLLSLRRSTLRALPKSAGVRRIAARVPGLCRFILFGLRSHSHPAEAHSAYAQPRCLRSLHASPSRCETASLLQVTYYLSDQYTRSLLLSKRVGCAVAARDVRRPRRQLLGRQRVAQDPPSVGGAQFVVLLLLFLLFAAVIIIIFATYCGYYHQFCYLLRLLLLLFLLFTAVIIIIFAIYCGYYHQFCYLL